MKEFITFLALVAVVLCILNLFLFFSTQIFYLILKSEHKKSGDENEKREKK